MLPALDVQLLDRIVEWQPLGHARGQFAVLLHFLEDLEVFPIVELSCTDVTPQRAASASAASMRFQPPVVGGRRNYVGDGLPRAFRARMPLG